VEWLFTLTLRKYFGMKECLWCKKEFQEKKPTAKYCSTSCRVMFNHKRGKMKDKVRDDVLVNLMAEMQKKLIAQIENSAFPPMAYPQDGTKGIISAVENDNGYNPPEDNYSTFEAKLKSCKSYQEIKNVVIQIDKSSLAFFPKKNLKELATTLSENFYTD